MLDRIAVVAGSPEWQRAVEREVPRFAVARFCDGPDELGRAVSAGGVDLVLTDLYDVNSISMMSVVKALRVERPALKVLFYVPAAEPQLEELYEAARNGVELDFALRPHESLDGAMKHALTAPSITGAVRLLAREIVPLVTRNTRPFVIIGALRPWASGMVSRIAAQLDVRERTLRGRFARAGLPNPAVMLNYCFALAATWLLQMDGWDPVKVARALALPGASALHVRLQHAVGLSLEQARRPGAFPMLRDQVVSELRRSSRTA